MTVMNRYRAAALAGAAAIAIVAAGPVRAQQPARNFDIAAQDLATALESFGKQSAAEVMFNQQDVAGKSAPALRGSYAPEEALEALLAGTGLDYRKANDSTFVVVRAAGEGERPGEQAAADAAAESDSTAQGGEQQSDGAIAEILVQGRRTQNVDIRRTEDDPQPYVVFDRKEIERSQATSLEEFFRARLSMNTMSGANSQNAAFAPNSSNNSSINLRGLGVAQTLILVDGRRAPRVLNPASGFTQADINGIPLSAIERIEVLPSTAGGIYGGGAMGGVINIIRKRDYHGLDLQASYTGTTRGGGETFKLELSGGFTLEGGKTQVSFAASHSASAPLYVEDRSFWRRAQALRVTNDPSFFDTPFAGYTTNIRSQTGAPLVLDDGRSLGSAITHVPVGYAGPGLDGGTGLLGGAGQYNLDLADNTAGRRRLLLSNPRVRSGNLNIRRSFGASLDAFIDLTASDNLARQVDGTNVTAVTLSAGAPANPFQQAISISVPLPGLSRPARNRSQVLAGTGGFIARLGDGWTATAEYGWSRSRTKATSTTSFYNTTAVNAAIASGSLDALRDVNIYPLDLTPYLGPSPDNWVGPSDTVQRLVTGRLSGGLVELPGGTLSLTALAEHRREKAKVSYLRLSSTTIVYPARTQAVNSGYVELRAPLVSARNAVPMVHELELQASVRHDRYRTHTASPSQVRFPPRVDIVLPDWDYDTARVKSTDYTLALRWAPLPDIAFRASYGTGFLPPAINQLTPSEMPVASAFGTPDQLRGNRDIGSEVPFLLIYDGNPDLKPEQSKSLTLGAIVTPRFLPGLRLSVDYSRIRKSNEITDPRYDVLLANPDLFPGRVERGPNLPNDPAGWPGPVTRLDATFMNLASTRVQTIDFQADYELHTQRLGAVRFYGVATWMDDYWQQPMPTAPGFDSVGHYLGPLKWRGNAGMNWSFGAWELSWNSQYYHSYSVRYGSPTSSNDLHVLRQGAKRIPSQIYHDLAVRYRFGSEMSLLSNVSISLGIQNLFDRYPPAVAFNGYGYSPEGDPRLRRFTVTVRKSFGS